MIAHRPRPSNATKRGVGIASILSAKKDGRSELRKRKNNDCEQCDDSEQLAHFHGPVGSRQATCGPHMASPQVPTAGQLSVVTSTTASAKA
jgi:hypothetical protein